MKLKYKFVINEVADNMVAVAVGSDLDKFNGFIKMNKVGAYIFKMLENDVTTDDIILSMKNDFEDATEEEIRETVVEFTEKLKNSDVIE